ncbi:phospholipase D1 isoform X2 [Thrips palmi]|nr:phospholipase D1 isoform X2 [Thrips palmi]XP_034255322.1 phospholipase D1 isoform X2 [Thrips palmi]
MEEPTERKGEGDGDSDYDEDLAIPEESLMTSPDGGEVTVTASDGVDTSSSLQALPFQSLYDTPLKFKSPQRMVFIPGKEIAVDIINNERTVTTHLLNPNLYTIQFQHGDFTWTVQKRYKHFHHLHNQLKIFRTSLKIPFPSKTHKERRASFKHDYQGRNRGKSKSSLPRFPSKPDALLRYDQVERRISELTEYLRNLLRINIYRNHHETANFLEVSSLSFVKELGVKGKESLIKKRTGSTQPGRAGCNCCGLLDSVICVRCSYLCTDICGRWRNRWLVCKDTFLCYISPKDGRVRSVILIDSGFEVSSGVYTSGLHRGLVVITHSRQVAIKCDTRRESKEWMAFLRDISYNQAHEFIQRNRMGSFAPVRMDTQASWFVDGSSYMAAVADAMESAKEEIFIADWWLSPEIYMKRPAIDGEHWRLDKIIQRKAAQGVKIFVLLYKEVQYALGINSYYSKQCLVKGHSENIKVLRHPDHAKAGVFLWAHHEKIVVVDQTYAFVGGIDLCYGRWDDHHHRLVDLGSISQNSRNSCGFRSSQTSSRPSGNVQPLMSLAASANAVGAGLINATANNKADDGYSNPDVLPQQEQQMPILTEEDLVMASQVPENIKRNTPEMQRKNILVKMKTRGKDILNKFHVGDDNAGFTASTDLATNSNDHSVSYTHGIQKQTNVNFNSDFIGAEKPVYVEPQPEKKKGIKTKTNGNSFIDGLSGSAKLWIGKDYVNFIVKDFNNLDLPYQDFIDRSTTPRMPWHDIGALVLGAAARDVARHFIQRWNAVKTEKAKLNHMYPCLLPKSYQDLRLNPHVKPFDGSSLYNVDCQVLRSVSSWSAGFLDSELVEQSIHEAYVDVINKAKHYVYIENQFFITQGTNAASVVRNQVGDALFKRILRAYKEGSIFRVFVVMPLLPGFEGEVGQSTGTALHAITHWNYSSICRGKDSLVQRLKDAGIRDTEEYISFFGLRNHSILQGGMVTELIYVHSKLLIADDAIVICGSANINDRSLVGKRDSEIAVYIQDRDFDPCTMAHEDYVSGRYAGSLRRHLFSEHLGLLDSDRNVNISDPASDFFYREVWLQTAVENTAIYEEVFHCIPSNQANSFASLKKYQEEIPLSHSDPVAAMKKLEGIKGHLVKLPLEFLANEVLTPNPSTVTGMMPTSLWT